VIKKSRAKRKPRTHFEQVSVEVVKKLVDPEGFKADRPYPRLANRATDDAAPVRRRLSRVI
jgi:hypothetical protein